jgi:PAS domain S-box-containing protein
MESTQRATRATVLVVDDNPANLLAMRATLGSDYNVVCVDSGEEAVATLQGQRDVDVILMDVQMPGMDGFEAASRIRQIPGHKDTPIVFVSAIFVEDPSIKKGYQVGGMDYFTKPFDPDILRQKVAVYASFRQRSEFIKERERHSRESEELARATRRLAALLQSLPVGVLMTDAQGSIHHATETFSRILGRGEPAEGDVFREIVDWWEESAQKVEDLRASLARALSTRESGQARVKVRCLDGATRTLVIVASPLLGVGGSTVGAAVLVQDVTEPEQIEKALEPRLSNARA